MDVPGGFRSRAADPTQLPQQFGVPNNKAQQQQYTRLVSICEDVWCHIQLCRGGC